MQNINNNNSFAFNTIENSTWNKKQSLVKHFNTLGNTIMIGASTQIN